MLLSLLGGALIVLGILFWTGHAFSLVPVHMLLGALFVICLWVLVALAFRVRVRWQFTLIVLVWSGIVPVLGLYQVDLLPSHWHWAIQTLHLLVGLVAIGLGHGLARSILVAATEADKRPLPA